MDFKVGEWYWFEYSFDYTEYAELFRVDKIGKGGPTRKDEAMLILYEVFSLTDGEISTTLSKEKFFPDYIFSGKYDNINYEKLDPPGVVKTLFERMPR